MASTTADGRTRRARWLAVGAAALAMLTIAATATPIGASGEGGGGEGSGGEGGGGGTTTEESSTSSTAPDDDDTTTSSEASTSSDVSTSSEASTSSDVSTSSSPGTGTTAPGATTAPAGTGPSASAGDFTATLVAMCGGHAGHPLLSEALNAAVGGDGSNRIVEILRTCDIQFVGVVDQSLGRPATNIEALIADPVNNVTPNQAQLDLLAAELAAYWRIADAWARTQVPAVDEGVSTSDVSTSDVSTTAATTPGGSSSTPEQSSTTTG